jgi:hypothetical protein
MQIEYTTIYDRLNKVKYDRNTVYNKRRKKPLKTIDYGRADLDD